jgi:hypothetical protein
MDQINLFVNVSMNLSQPAPESLISRPPKLIYKPSPALMREQILRSLHIKDEDEFIKDNKIIDIKLWDN